MNYEVLTAQVEEYTRNYFRDHHHPKLLYHNLAHTENVAAIAKQIGIHYKLPPDELFIVSAAAWLHDLGYFQGYSDHEENGAKFAEGFLKQQDVEQKIIDAVKNCIVATKMPQKPGNFLEQVVCDADLCHFSQDNFWELSKLLCKELELSNNIKIDKVDWYRTTIQMLEQHKYFTSYCREHLNKRKKKNLEKLKKKLPLSDDKINPIARLLQTQPVQEYENKWKNKKDENPERTIQTMFRITSGNSQRLSDQADTKAHIMISVNSIIISILLSVLIRRIDENSNLTIPALLILLVNLLTLVFAILATRPNVPHGTFNLDDLENKKVNLLFFGNFYRMNFEEYCEGMFKVMDDKYFLYLSLLRDVYQQGVILGKKYRMLKIAYNIFMYGLIVSVLAFFIAAKL